VQFRIFIADPSPTGFETVEPVFGDFEAYPQIDYTLGGMDAYYPSEPFAYPEQQYEMYALPEFDSSAYGWDPVAIEPPSH